MELGSLSELWQASCHLGRDDGGESMGAVGTAFLQVLSMKPHFESRSCDREFGLMKGASQILIEESVAVVRLEAIGPIERHFYAAEPIGFTISRP